MEVVKYTKPNQANLNQTGPESNQPGPKDSLYRILQPTWPDTNQIMDQQNFSTPGIQSNKNKDQNPTKTHS